MAFSLYEIDGYQDVAKPSDLMGERYFVPDFYTINKPEKKYIDLKPDNDNEIQDVQWDDLSYNFSPSNWDQPDNYLVKKSKELVSLYRLEHEPLILSFSHDKKSHKVRVAISIADLMRATSRFSMKRAPRTNVRLIKSDPKKMRYVYQVRGYEGWSDKSGHQVIIELGKDPEVKSLNLLDVKVSCSCPFWKYRGPDFNAEKGDYLEGKPFSNLKFPSERDPSLHNLICKHVYAVGLIIEKVMVRHNLNVQKEVDNVLEVLEDMEETFLPDITLEGVQDLVKRLKASDRRELDNLLTKYEKERNEDKKESIFQDILKELKKVLDSQERSFLLRLLNDVKNFFSFNKKKKKKDDDDDSSPDDSKKDKKKKKWFWKKENLNMTSSRVDRVISGYLKETGDYYDGDLHL